MATVKGETDVFNNVDNFIERSKALIDKVKITAEMKQSVLEKRISDVIDEQIQPGVAMHGGTVSFSHMNHETGMVTVEMAGSCSGCSSSTATLKMGVEQMLMYKFPEDVTGVDADFGEVTNPYYTDTRDGYNPWRTE